MHYKIFLQIVLSNLMVLLIGCNTGKKEPETNKRKPFLLYFNQRDTLTFKKEGGLLSLKDTFRIVPYYRKGTINVKNTDLQGISFRLGSEHRYVQKRNNPKHVKRYIPKDSFLNYEIVKVPWKGFNINILDLTNPDSAFIVTVDYVNIQE